jgi:hypothetical protein
MDTPDFSGGQKDAGCFMPDLEAGYNPVRRHGLAAVEGDSNDV